MKEPEDLIEEYADEQAVLSRLIAHAEDRLIIASVLTAEDFTVPVHKRLYSALMSAPVNEFGPIGLNLYALMRARTDGEAADLIVELSFIESPVSIAELVQLAISVRNRSTYYDELCIFEEAIEENVEEPTVFDIPVEEIRKIDEIEDLDW